VSFINDYEAGQVHKLFVTRAQRSVLTLVKLVAWLPEESDGLNNPTGDWKVEDLRDGRYEHVGEDYLSRETFNEMEVLAWAAQ
jgi:hypothetical protein